MKLWGVCLGLLLLVGCAPSQDQLRMQLDLEEMKRRLAQLEVRQAEAVQAGSSEENTLQRQVAETLAGLDNLRVELQSINGRVDDMSHNRSQDGSELQLLKDDIDLQLNAIQAQFDQLSERVDTLEQAPSVETRQPEVQAPAATPEQLYQHALDLIRTEEKFAQGRELMEKFIKENPQHELYVNGLYWIGEALYGEKKYEQAILQLQDVISRYRSHDKAPAAMLKQALAFDALGDKQNARTTMQKLTEDYPASAQAETAKAYLAK